MMTMSSSSSNLVIVCLCLCLPRAESGSLMSKSLLQTSSSSNSARYSVGAALRYLSKAVLTGALLKDDAPSSVLSDLQSTSLQDSGDCVKRLLCELQQKTPLDWDEKLILDAIQTKIDYASPIVQLQLAAHLGTKKPSQCQVVYNRCSLNGSEIIDMDSSSTEIESNTTEDEEDYTDPLQ